MDRTMGLRVVGFTYSGPSQDNLLSEEVLGTQPNHKLRTQRSLLSELLAIHASGDLNGDGESEMEDDVSESDEDDAGAGLSLQRQGESGNLDAQRSDPIPIAVSESFANQRAKDAYRRMLYQRQVEQLHQQQQQQAYYAAQQQQQQALAAQQALQHAQLQQHPQLAQDGTQQVPAQTAACGVPTVYG